ncbi:MAG: heme o synthase [Planctomycetaceae bacterium]
MSTVSAPPPLTPTPALAAPGDLALSPGGLATGEALPLRSRLKDFIVLGKPRIAIMSLLVVAAGYFLGLADGYQAAPLWPTLGGIGLVAVASSALNQVLERRTDALMRRTSRRPLPAGRLGLLEAASFGVCTGLAGLAWLLAVTNLQTTVWSAVTLVMYVFVYTPLKRQLPLATSIGAIPGAMPVVLGWLAAGRNLDSSAFTLFAIQFLWQFPPFLAIAWIYREDYARAGLKMLPTRHEIPRVTGMLALAYAVALVPVSLLPTWFDLAGRLYLVGALGLSLWYVWSALQFALAEDRDSARSLLRTSLVYLPVLLALLVWDHYQLLS